MSTIRSPLPLCLLFIWISFLSTDVLATLNTTTENTVSNVGNQTTLQCSTDTSSFLTWKWFKLDGTSCVVYNGVGIVSTCVDNTRYSITHSGVPGGQYDLVITSTQAADAGTYLCEESMSPYDGAAAILGVVSAVSSVTQSPTTNCMLGGDTVTLTCTTSYSGNSTLVPLMMTWTKSDGTLVKNGTISSTTGVFQSTHTIPASNADIPPHICTVTFKSPTASFAPPSSNNGPVTNATNAPSYNQSSTPSAGYTVHYCSDNVTISAPGYPDLSGETDLLPGTVLTCNVSTASSPGTTTTYQWIDNLTGNPTNSNQVTVTGNSTYNFTCTATSVTAPCNGTSRTCIGSKTVTGNGPGEPNPNPCNAACIGAIVGSIAGALLIAMIVVMACCCCPRCPWYDLCPQCPGYHCCKCDHCRTRLGNGTTGNAPDKVVAVNDQHNDQHKP